jgi:hypothetical protein
LGIRPSEPCRAKRSYGHIDFNPDGLDWIDEGLGAFLATWPE